MIDIVLLVIVIVVSVLVLATTTYQMALYIHHDDKGWGRAVYCKVLVVIAMAMVWVQALLLPLDVASRKGDNFMEQAGIDMQVFWSIVLFISLGLAVILLPYAIFLYETDNDEVLLKRMLRAFAYLFVEMACVAVVLLVSWYFLRQTELPVKFVQVSLFNSQTSQIVIGSIQVSRNSGDRAIYFESNIFVYTIAICSFVGWILLIIFGGVGLFALPLDFINAFLKRPQVRTTSQMKETRDQMNLTLQRLFQNGKELKKRQETYRKNTEDGWFRRFKTNRELGRQFNVFKAQFNALSQTFDVFQIQLRYASTNPFVPFLKIIVGILFLLTSIVWIFEVALGFLVTISSQIDPFYLNFLNRLLVFLDQSSAQVVSTIILLYLSLYLIWCVQKGTIRMGVQIPWLFRFHPMKQNQTWMNSFLFNLILLLLASSSVTQFIVLCLPSYSQTTLVYSLFAIQIRYMKFYSFFYNRMIFPISFVVWSGLVLIYLLATCNRPPKYIREVQAIKAGYKYADDFEQQ